MAFKWQNESAAFGFVTEPKSKAEYVAAKAAREVIEGLKCREEVRRKLAEGANRTHLVDWIQKEKGEADGIAATTLRRYLGFYVKFFLTPFEVAVAQGAVKKAKGEQLPGTISDLVAAKIRQLSGRVVEIEWLTEMVKKQEARIAAGLVTETALSFLMPTVGAEMERYVKMVEVLMNKKMELGLSGYKRAPQQLNLGGSVSIDRFEGMSAEDREHVVKFGAALMEMIELRRGRDGVFRADQIQKTPDPAPGGNGPVRTDGDANKP
ncbi:MAG: hypothetical protein HYY46_22730 [Deltaproteobacteria bacterium]|nr:hypothetical protein [Deltaproteobacteria bacterium]